MASRSSGDPAERLEAILLEALALTCLTGDEGPMADWFAERCHADVRRVGNSVVAGDLDDPRPTVLLVSHLDVVPPTDADREPSVARDRVVGRGASDMKSGLAVSLDVFADAALRGAWANVVLVGYAGEEGSVEDNELARVLEAVPQLSAATLAIVLEPTDLEVQLGCLGGLHARVTFVGRAAHSARPWHGDNALTNAGGFLAELHDRDPEEVAADGLPFVEVFSATQAWTDNARNVIPDRFTVNLNYRYSPARTEDEAIERLTQLVAGRADIDVIDRAPPAPPHRDHPAVRRFAAVTDARLAPKQAWTDVARFAEVGVAALNYGPGLVAQAHQRGEYVPRVNLVAARDALAAFLTG